MQVNACLQPQILKFPMHHVVRKLIFLEIFKANSRKKGFFPSNCCPEYIDVSVAKHVRGSESIAAPPGQGNLKENKIYQLRNFIIKTKMPFNYPYVLEEKKWMRLKKKGKSFMSIKGEMKIIRRKSATRGYFYFRFFLFTLFSSISPPHCCLKVLKIPPRCPIFWRKIAFTVFPTSSHLPYKGKWPRYEFY